MTEQQRRNIIDRLKIDKVGKFMLSRSYEIEKFYELGKFWSNKNEFWLYPISD